MIEPPMTNPLRRVRFRRDHRWAPDRLSAYLDAELVPRSRTRLEHHLRDCPECLAALHGLERLLGRLHAAPALAELEPGGFASAVRRQLRDSAPR
jgi:anti-sigma factor RsiW